MSDEPMDQEGLSRREYVKYGGMVVGGGLLAGCSGGSDSTTQTGSDSPTTQGDSPGSTTTETTTTTEGRTTTESQTTTEAATTTESQTTTETAPTTSETDGTTGEPTAVGESYSVRMAPVGEVTFDEVPTKWLAGTGDWADMGVALGLGAPEALWLPERFHSYHYRELPGVSIDESSIQTLYSDGVSKELFYDIDADLHVFDPNFLENRYKGWEKADIDELEGNVAPYFGNTLFSHDYPWHDYQYYSIYDAFGKLAAVFHREERHRALRSVHEQLVSDVQSRLPAENERPSVAVLYPQPVEQPDSFLPYPLNDGTMFAHMNTLKLNGAFGEDVNSFTNDRGSVDYETLLEIDPDVLLFEGNETKSGEEFRTTTVSYLENQAVAGQLTAVRNGDVYRAGGLYQGPIINLFLIERLARKLYANRFGSGRLFDRQRVADIVNGTF